MQIYLVTAILVFSFIAYVFWQDQDASKKDFKAWLFIAFAASIWPITLPNMIRKVVTKWLKTRKYSRLFNNPPTPFSVYETSPKQSAK